jgi:hypothetical protein
MVTGCLGRRWSTDHVRGKPLGRPSRFRTRGRQVVWTIRNTFLGGRSPVYNSISSMVICQTGIDNMLGAHPQGIETTFSFLPLGSSHTLRQRPRPYEPRLRSAEKGAHALVDLSIGRPPLPCSSHGYRCRRSQLRLGSPFAATLRRYCTRRFQE